MARQLNFSNPFESQPLGFLLNSTSEKKITKITLEINNYATLEFPVDLSKGTILAYEGGQYAVVYDNQWNVIKKYPIDSTKLGIPKGDHSIIIAIEGPDGSEIKAELFVKGNKTSIHK